jgi:NAD(P)-dependent dehydrogenase (short-subunit alcohol dehydrogenase family)
MSDLRDMVALVTGASSGIGRATAEAFAAKGASVVLAARREDELASLANEIRNQGGKASCVTTDVSVARDVERMVAHTLETFGRLDYAVNNAGIEGKFAGVVDLPEEEWDRVLNINLVNVGSINSFLGFPSGAAYVSSKHGLIGLTTSVSAELAPQGIRVNLVCPGFIDTPMHQRGRGLLGDEIYDNMLQQRVHTRRVGRPEEIARSVLFLCSEEASYITGTTLTPDGGFTLTI